MIEVIKMFFWFLYPLNIPDLVAPDDPLPRHPVAALEAGHPALG